MISEQYRIVTSNVTYPLKAKRTTRVVLFAERGVALWFGWIAQVGHDEAHLGEHLALMPFHFGYHVAGQVPTLGLVGKVVRCRIQSDYMFSRISGQSMTRKKQERDYGKAPER
jgi:hypothetical protein